jgi:hypothetical protein
MACPPGPIEWRESKVNDGARDVMYTLCVYVLGVQESPDRRIPDANEGTEVGE